MKVSPNQWPGAEPPQYVHEFVDWLIDPDNAPHNKAGWAREHGFDRKTVYRWSADPRVRKLIDERAQELNLSPDRIQDVINAVHHAAVGGDMKAAQLYLQHVDRLAPKRIIHEDRTISAMSDMELQALLGEHGLLEEAHDASGQDSSE